MKDNTHGLVEEERKKQRRAELLRARREIKLTQAVNTLCVRGLVRLIGSGVDQDAWITNIEQMGLPGDLSHTSDDEITTAWKMCRRNSLNLMEISEQFLHTTDDRLAKLQNLVERGPVFADNVTSRLAASIGSEIREIENNKRLRKRVNSKNW